MKVIFMGTPEFAVPALQKLLDNKKVEIVAIYTKEPKMAGRGKKIVKSKIHELALKHNIEVFTPKNFKEQSTVETFQNLKADLALVVAYGLILPKIIIESTKFGIINIHPSILPKYRGATPIQSTLFASDNEIGVSIIKMDEGIDSGDIILQEKFPISESDNYANLAPKLAEIGAEMAQRALFLLFEGKAKLTKQDDEKSSLSKKIEKNDAKIDFNTNAQEIFNKIRALSGFMTAFFEFKDEKIKIFDSKIIKEAQIQDYEKFKIGEIVNQDFVIKCQKEAIQPLILQRSGKNPVKIDDFLRGFVPFQPKK